MIQKAKKGNQKACYALYESHKRMVYSLAFRLLQNKAAASNVTVWVFQDVRSLLNDAIETEAQLKDLLAQRTVKYCRKKTEAKGAKQLYPKFDAARAAELIDTYDATKAEEVPVSVDQEVRSAIRLSAQAKKSSADQNSLRLIGMVAGIVFVVAAVVAALFMFLGKDDAKKTYYADIEIEDYGTISLELDAETAPITVENFVNLAKSGFYDGLTFHRIMEGFMMQGGDPEGTGRGGAEETIVGEFSANGYENNIAHKRGVISMARSGYSYDSASSQFFIVHKDAPSLNGQYAAFGHVTSGMEIVDAICEKFGPDDGTVPATEQPVIKSITIK